MKTFLLSLATVLVLCATAASRAADKPLGSADITNNVGVTDYAIVTKGGGTKTWRLPIPSLFTQSGATNFATWAGTSLVIDASKAAVEVATTNDVTIAHATNGAAGVWQSGAIRFVGGATNRTLILPAALVYFGCTQTNTLRSNVVTYLHFNVRGLTSTSGTQTNCDVKLEEQ